MPTKHRRIAVRCDEELARALRRGRRALGEKPAASLVHELALRGAQSLPEADEELELLVRKYGATRPTGTWAAFRHARGPLPPFDPSDPTPGTDALRVQRRDRV